MNATDSPFTEGKDHISNLHESLISNILSRLNTSEAVRTSVLSKNWEFKWTSVCGFNISYNCVYCRRKDVFYKFVDRVLLCSQDITSFCFEDISNCSPTRLSTWISTVLKRKIQNINILAFLTRSKKGLVLPFTPLTNPSLSKLKLVVSCTFKNIDATSCFPNLKSLYLWDVQFVNGNSSVDTTSLTFPVLETWETIYCKWVNLKFVKIYAPRLIVFSSETREAGSYLIKLIAPKLAKMELLSWKLENIVMDDLACDDVYNFGKLLDGFSRLKELNLSYYVAEVLRPAGLFLRYYDRMTRLTLDWFPNAEVAIKLLHAMPQLNFFASQVGYWADYDFDAIESIPSCIIFHLEEVAILSYSNEGPRDKFIKFVLKNGAVFTKFYFEKLGNKSQQNRIVERLSTFQRKQASLTLCFDDPDESETIVLET